MGALDQALTEQLREGLAALGQDPSVHPCDGYLAYLQLLLRWNSAYNLTGTRDLERLVSHHILDSLSILELVEGPRALDIGTGAGLPGLILALARPAVRWTLLDSNQKKIRFLNQVLQELKPANVEVVRTRAQEYQPEARFNTVVSRALGPVARFIDLARPLLAENGVMLAMKGRAPEVEVAEAPMPELDATIRALSVPGVDAARSVVILHTPTTHGSRTTGDGPVR